MPKGYGRFFVLLGGYRVWHGIGAVTKNVWAFFCVRK